MKILQIAPIMKGGAGLVEVYLSEGLVKLGHTVHMVSAKESSNGDAKDWDMLLERLYQAVIPHYPINFFNREIDLFWNEVIRLKALVEKSKYDIIHVHSGVPAFGAKAAVDLLGGQIPIVATFHSWNINRPEWMNTADVWSFNQTNRVVFDSRHYYEFGIEQGISKSKSEVIDLGILIDPDKYSNAKQLYRQKINKEFGIPETDTLLVQLGGITRRKGQLDFLKAFKEVSKEKPDCSAVIVGDIRQLDYYEEIMDFIHINNLNNKVWVLGWVADPYEIVKAADLFVFPTYSEGLGLVLLEAMVLDTPVVSSYVEGTKDILKEGFNALTIEPGDIGTLKEKICFTLECKQSTEERVSRAKIWAGDNYNFDKTVRNYLSLYESLLSR